ncbi:unnamed protein product [Paramecium sonneborni]|uniref:Fatty acid hydroxylase domain-containing protein n=1 Tax=Paramecium sonneborni TaxID=65129 RepID=A0A8S1LDV4_9CILI|nr:unnamed protein product [Paramecium sonneborni]
MIQFHQILLLLFTIMIPVVGDELDKMSFSEKHIYINNFQHYVENIFLGFIGAIVQYFMCCSFIEYLNPMPKTKLRVQNILKEIRFGIPQLMFGSFVSMSFYYYIYPYTPYYKYFEIRDYSIHHLIYGVGFHCLWKIFNGYWIHRLLHQRQFYQYIHSIHHSFKEPTSFGYCAGHPLEGFLLGTMILHSAEVLIPIHPLQTMIFGLLFAIKDMLAHDGNILDYEDHYRHHLYYVVNFGNPILDKLFGTSYNPKNYPIKQKCSYISEFKNQNNPLFLKYQ